MKIKQIIEEDFTNYKKPSMFIGTAKCDFKCCLENNIPTSACQNSELYNSKTIEIDDNKLCQRYLENPITKAVVFGGLEPFKQFNEIHKFIEMFRNSYGCFDDIVIYTGYYPNELQNELSQLKKYKNIIVKFGRFIPNSESIYDNILGIKLISKNQYAERIS